jgi:hypothetical protein
MIKDYLVEWWAYSQKKDDYVDHECVITASSPDNAINLVSSKYGYIYRAGKNWKAREVEVISTENNYIEYKLKE